MSNCQQYFKHLHTNDNWVYNAWVRIIDILVQIYTINIYNAYIYIYIHTPKRWRETDCLPVYTSMVKIRIYGTKVQETDQRSAKQALERMKDSLAWNTH